MEIFGEAKIRGSENQKEITKSIFYERTLVLILMRNARHASLFDNNNIVLPCV